MYLKLLDILRNRILFKFFIGIPAFSVMRSVPEGVKGLNRALSTLLVCGKGRQKLCDAWSSKFMFNDGTYIHIFIYIIC